jgi:hypothetical protein
MVIFNNCNFYLLLNSKKFNCIVTNLTNVLIYYSILTIYFNNIFPLSISSESLELYLFKVFCYSTKQLPFL